jgi:hypothetical protein
MRCTGRAPESMSRRTVRGDKFNSSAVSPMVRSLVRSRPRTAVPVAPEAVVDVLRGVLEVTFPAPLPRYGGFGSPALR